MDLSLYLFHEQLRLCFFCSPMIVASRNLRTGSSVAPGRNKALFLQPAIPLPIIRERQLLLLGKGNVSTFSGLSFPKAYRGKSI